jgi:glycosyltransferase involved in cell wall biosynthesis
VKAHERVEAPKGVTNPDLFILELSKSAMKIVQVCFDQVPDHIGGMYTAVDSFQRALSTEDDGPTPVIGFVARNKRDEGKMSVECDGMVRVLSAKGPLGRYYSWSSHRKTAVAEEILRTAQIVIIHLLYRYHAQWAASCARRYRIPTFVVPHGCLARQSFVYAGWKKRLWLTLFGPSVLGRSKAIIFASHREGEEASRYHFGAQGVVIPWSTPLVCTDDKLQASRKIRSAYGIPQSDRVLLYVGRLHPIKRIWQTLFSFARMAPGNWHMLVVGPDSPILGRQGLEALLTGPAKVRIHFTGPVFGDEKYDYYKASDVYVLLSHFENFSYTTAEALACGLPVMISREVGLSDELSQIRCGWVVNARDNTAIHDALKEVFQATPTVLQAMGERGQLWVRQNLNFDTFRKRLLDLVSTDIENST